MKLPIRARLTILYVLALVVILSAVGSFLLVRLRSDLVAGVDGGLATRAAQISVGLRTGCEGEFRDLAATSIPGLQTGEIGAQLLSPSGSVLESTGDAVTQAPLVTGATLTRALAGQSVAATIRAADGESFRILALAIPGGSCPGAIVVVSSLEEVQRSIDRLLVLLAFAIPAATLAAGASGWWLAGRALSPVAKMTREASELGAARLDQRIEVPDTPDELSRLAETLNGLLDRVQRGVDDRRRFVADASHELRTPLAVLRSELEVRLLDDDLDGETRALLQSMQEEVERMGTTVDHLLVIARNEEGGLRLSPERVSLKTLATSVVGGLAPLVDARGIRASVEGPEVETFADRARLEQVVSNLLRNAVRHARSNGTVLVSSWRRNGEVGVSVADDGPGIDPAIAGSIFERFVRAEASDAQGSSGSGLGLAICREIVEAHGGRIWVDRGTAGGASFSFALPSLDHRDGRG